ncbi:MAG: hypothetical protein LUM44_18965 [Pyrinomonadaceae bacterium]|nr:hypothetical protein [Pyrinomonadaceae bacterium]
MSNRKNYNSIFFLTVYLGLVLVGATPQVLAQAAMTRQFDIKNEIVVEDDLDKKPDEELDFSGAINDYFHDLKELIEDLQKYNRNEKFDLDSERFAFKRNSSLTCNKGYDPVVSGYFNSKVIHPKIEKALDYAIYNFDDWESFSDFLHTENTLNNKNYSTHRFEIDEVYDTSQLSIEISVPKKNAQKADFLAEKFNQTLRIYEVDEENAIIETSYQNTSIRSENNQVFIVTRLPRGSIDDLLNEKDAQ